MGEIPDFDPGKSVGTPGCLSGFIIGFLKMVDGVTMLIECNIDHAALTLNVCHESYKC